MDQGERKVILMLDEIHISTKLSYKQGKLEGTALNCSLEGANTAQVFLISSVLSKSKDVAGIIPIKNLTGETLTELTKSVLEMLHRVGFKVVCVISDNNRVNRTVFTNMCGGKLQLFIKHPHDESDKLFFLFDTVHLAHPEGQ